MRQSVRSAFNAFTARFEGRVAWMYLDIKGLVTIAVGNLIDPASLAAALPFTRKDDGGAASADEIAAEWAAVKARQELKNKRYTVFEPLTNLRLGEGDIDALVLQRLDANERVLANTFSDWDAWPADAQLGVLSMAWALGAGFTATWPKFTAACRARDWATAAAQSHIDDTGNPGVAPRNAADLVLFNNATAVEAQGLDFDTLYYPNDAAAAAPAAPPAEQPQAAPPDAAPFAPEEEEEEPGG